MIDTTYTISQTDFVEAQKIWCSKAYKKLPGRILTQAVSIVLGVFIGLTFQYLPLWIGVGLAASLLAVLLVCRWRKKAIRRYQYSVNADRMETVHVTIDGTGYRDEKAANCGGWIDWSGFTGWRESPTIFVIGQNLTFVTVPKTAMSAGQQQELRSLLQAHLGAST